MNRTFSETQLEELLSKFHTEKTQRLYRPIPVYPRQPINIMRCTADQFEADILQQTCEAALSAIDSYAPDFVSFARAMWLTGADTLPQHTDLIQELEFELVEDSEKVKADNYAAWFAWAIYRDIIDKFHEDPIEELQIDLFDSSRAQTGGEIEETAVRAANRLARGSMGSLPRFTGVSLPSVQQRTLEILDLFLSTLVEEARGKLPPAIFFVTVANAARDEIAALTVFLSQFERQRKLAAESIKISFEIASPRSILGEDQQIVLGKLANAAGGRCFAAHLDGDSFLNELNIPAVHRHARHESLNFARQIMQLVLSPMGIGLSDSIMPSTTIPPGADIQAVHRAWREHFNAVTHSMIGGFYQGLDPHPILLPARYAAVYSFFMEGMAEQGKRVRDFIRRAAANPDFKDTQAAQATLNFFYRAQRCGALTLEQLEEATGLTRAELLTISFREIMADRQTKAAAS
jgi:hypothetical protein